MGIYSRMKSRGIALVQSLRTNGYLPTYMHRLMRKVCVLAKRRARLLTWLARDFGTLTFSLSLQTLTVLLSVGVVLALSLLSLMLIPIVLVRVLTSSRTRNSRRS